MHSFSDFSGVVFFNKNSGETVTLHMGIDKLLVALDEYYELADAEKSKHTVHSLVAKSIFSLREE